MNPVITALGPTVERATTVMASATELINGLAARQQAAIDKALENGATAEQLAPVQAEVDSLTSGADQLAAAVAANTVAATEPPVA